MGTPEQIPPGKPPGRLLKALGLSGAAVAALFIIYELVEQRWLAQLPTEDLFFFHLLRGLSAGVVATVMTALVLTRPDAGRDLPWRSEPPASTFRRRLQRVRLRTKLLVPILAVAILPAAGVGLASFQRLRVFSRDEIHGRLHLDTRAKADRIETFLEDLRTDLFFLSQMPGLRTLAASQRRGSTDLRHRVERQLLAFSQSKRAYYQVRFVDARGREVVRLNLRDGHPAIVPPGELQDKSGRYYVTSALQLRAGAIYTSDIDLNIEHGVVELPERRVVRFATTVRGDDSIVQGIVVINVDIEDLLSLAGPFVSDAVALLVAPQGTVVAAHGRARSMTQTAALVGRPLVATFPDASWPEAPRAAGEPPVARFDGLVLSTAQIPFDLADATRRLALFVGYPVTSLEAPISQLALFLTAVIVFAVLIAIVAGILMGAYLVRPILRLRAAARAMAAGDLDQRVFVTTGDELEELARDFNTMTERLKTAQSKLATWNVELQREVEKKTESLQKLQAGFSRADKLATVGQMTAAVMHEVGNPLAAIKTQIQVELEDGNVQERQRHLLQNIEREVDRLSGFLRSVSRLSRLHEPRRASVNLTAMCNDVASLLGPELKRRELRIDSRLGGPATRIQGDPELIRQLIINLVINAAEASEAGNAIQVSIESRDTTAVLRITDCGSGVSEDLVQRVWEPFFTTKRHGTGLGLAICREIVEGHRGVIELASEPSRGTTVVVTLPKDGQAEVASPSEVPE